MVVRRRSEGCSPVVIQARTRTRTRMVSVKGVREACLSVAFAIVMH